MKYVKDYMNTPVFMVEGNTNLQEACKLMLERGVGSIVITENGTPKGIFTDRDAIKAIASGLSPNDEVRLASTMQSLITVRPSTDITEAVTLMLQNKIRHLPVVDEKGNIVGILSIVDASKAVQDLRP
ncbi:MULTISPECIES: CBS domain-containing protein [Acidianus]|uniref:Histidine kinase n=1 Tax=Candidatus Acidianus copahuensis TaxID=1160895 RepID=A0A031LKZ0_9CREN|nr:MULTISPECIES: CBS domain-containing protein [Acidianus]EZQ04727.1 histidine kinase [Candidatus Acidianus copahuensis]NON63035.1 CBS domain-containing protein [Acidianus sp. RZ1]